jgi:hypothetical protein
MQSTKYGYMQLTWALDVIFLPCGMHGGGGAQAAGCTRGAPNFTPCIDVQRAGPVRPWPARAGPGQPAAGRYGLRATRVGPPTDTGRDLGPWPGPWVI